VRHKNRDVADYPDAAFVAVSFEREPLAKKKKLKKFVSFDFIMKPIAGLPQRKLFTAHQGRLPFGPRRAIVIRLEGAKQSVVFQPGLILFAELFELAERLGVGRALIILARFAQDFVF
jgi:hypothetical protein